MTETSEGGNALPEGPGGRRRRFGVAVALAVVSSVGYLPSLRNGFVGWDDMVNFVDNRDFRGFAWKNIRWAWTTYLMGVYQPLGWMIHEVQYLVWGMNPLWYHLASVLFHAAIALALWALTLALLDRVGRAAGAPVGDRPTAELASAIAVALFAVHPLRVEAVAWASCQTYLPSILFAILSVSAYLRACDAGTDSPSPWWLAGAWVLFALALLTKVAVVSLPFVLLILDVYPLRRVGPGRWWGRSAWRVYLEKFCFVALAVPFMVAAVQARWPSETRPKVGVNDLAPRLAQSVYGLWFYPIKTVFPYKVSAYYPLPARLEDYYRWPFVAAAVATALAFVAAFFLRRRSPGLVAALACYLVCLTPSLGIIRTTQNIAANRYCYVASMAGVVVLAYGLTRLARRPRLWRLSMVLTAGLVVGLSTMTWRHCVAWHSMDALWAQAGYDGAEHYESNLKFGITKEEEGRNVEARHYLLQALTDRPDSLTALYHLAWVAWKVGNLTEAEERWSQVLSQHPDAADAMTGIGLVRAAQGRLKEAEQWHRRALQAKPTDLAIRKNLADVLERQGEDDAALEELAEIVRIDPRNTIARFNLGQALVRRGEDAQAIVEFSEAIRFRPGYANAHAAMGSALLRVGLPDEAIAEFESALATNPRHPEARRELDRLRKSRRPDGGPQKPGR